MTPASLSVLMNKHQYFLLFKRLGLLISLYTLCRILFLLFNLKQFEEATVGELALSFLLGLKFDAAIVCLVNILFIPLSLLPFSFVPKKGYQQFLEGLFLLTNVPLLFLNLIDAEYYKFIGRRTTVSLLGISNDVSEQLGQLFSNYWHIGALGILITLLLIWFYPSRYTLTTERTVRPLPGIALTLLSIGLCILVFRGGLQEKPLRVNNAFVLHSNSLGNLSLNTAFTFLTSMDMKGTQKVDYFPQPDQVQKLISRDTQGRQFRHEQPQNVVIIILESFASEYLGYGNPYQGYTPFLDSLASKSLFFTNNFANGRESIDAVPAITASIPHLMDEPFITSLYQSNEVYGLAAAVKKAGYATSFFHGGRNGTMGFEAFAQIAGFDKYYGFDEYPTKDQDFDGNWGIFDEPFLQFFASELGKQKQPFLSTVFTLSSHQPYTIPAQHQGKFPKGTQEIHESIGYADYALRKFFATASKQEWFKNTLFVFTGDHTQASREAKYANPLGSYRVPLILYHPAGNVAQVDTSKVTQHVDIMPTVLDYLHQPLNQTLPFGQSVFSPRRGMALHYSLGTYHLVQNDFFMEMNENNGLRLFDFKKDQAQTTPLRNGLVENWFSQRLKAYIQFYNNGLIENSWQPKANAPAVLTVRKTAGGN